MSGMGRGHQVFKKEPDRLTSRFSLFRYLVLSSSGTASSTLHSTSARMVSRKVQHIVMFLQTWPGINLKLRVLWEAQQLVDRPSSSN